MNVQEILSRLQGVRQTGKSEWMCLCPGHRDTNGSLHITEEVDGTVKMHCFGGCDTKTVVAAMGLKMSDLFPDGGNGKRQKYGCTLAEYAMAKKLAVTNLQAWGVADGLHESKNGRRHNGVRMEYRSADGAVQAVRWRMCLEKNSGSNGQDMRFVWDKGAKLCLYGLWRLGEWPKMSLILVEGESDCHSLWSAGYAAMGLPGASNYRPERDNPWLDLFQQIYVVIERDDGGKKLYQSLMEGGLARKILAFCVPGAKDSSALWCSSKSVSDFTDAMMAGFSQAVPLEQFQAPAEWAKGKGENQGESQTAAPDAEATHDGRAETSPVNGLMGGRPKADLLGAASQFVAQFTSADGQFTLHHWREGWWKWDGRKYVSMMDSDIEAMGMSFLQDPAVMDAYNVQPSKNALVNLLANLRSNSFCSVESKVGNNTWLDRGVVTPDVASFGNVLVDLGAAADYQAVLDEVGGDADPAECGGFMANLTPAFLATAAHEYDYNPGAQCPKFMVFLDDVAPSKAVQETLRQMFGACLTQTTFDRAFILYGDAGTGKSTCLKILEMVIGHDNVCSVPLLDFGEKFRLWPLAEKLVNVVEELSTDDPMGKMRYIEGDFKNQITGGMITVEKKGKDTVMAKCIAKHVFATNSLPTFFDKSSGVWDRLIIIPFFQRIRNTAKQVTAFEETLRDELPGILNWALGGLGAIRRQGNKILEDGECLELKQEHRDRCDQDGVFIRETFWLSNDESFVPLQKAYDAYCHYLTQNGFAHRTSLTFQTAMQRVMGVKALPRSKTDRQRGFKGVSMIFNADNPL